MYECLHKPRSNCSERDTELQKRLNNERNAGLFKSYSLVVEDLQEVEILERRKRLGKGELSSIAFAKRTGQAFLTDDQKAQRLAHEVMPGLVQTIPHLFGWLLFQGTLKDSEKTTVIAEHEEAGLPLRKCFDETYLVVQQYRSFSGK